MQNTACSININRIAVNCSASLGRGWVLVGSRCLIILYKHKQYGSLNQWKHSGLRYTQQTGLGGGGCKTQHKLPQEEILPSGAEVFREASMDLGRRWEKGRRQLPVTLEERRSWQLYPWQLQHLPPARRDILWGWIIWSVLLLRLFITSV